MDEFRVNGVTPHSGRRESGTVRYWAVTRQCLLGLSLAIACQASFAQEMYRITPLGYLGGCTSSVPVARGLNLFGQVAGTACNAHGDTHAFLWRHDGTPMVDLGPGAAGTSSEATDLATLGMVTGDAQTGAGEYAFESSSDGTSITKILNDWGGSSVLPYDMNDRGMLTGAATTADDAATHAFVWQNNGSPIEDLGTLGGDFSTGAAVNESLQVTGSSDLSVNSSPHAFLWLPDGSGMQDLGTLGGNFSNGLFINAAGNVVGTSNLVPNGRGHAFFKSYFGPMQDLGTLGGTYSVPTAFNNGDVVAGNSYKSGPKTTHAFVWMNHGAPMQDLGTLGGTRSFANAINPAGQVTGSANLAGDAVTHAFLWRNDGSKIQDLNKLIDPADPLRPFIALTQGQFINNSADVVAVGTDSRTGRQDLYLLQGTVLTLTPHSLAFGDLPIHTTSAVKSVSLTNNTNKVVYHNVIQLAGVAATQFAFTDNCGAALGAHKSCTIKLTFKPTTKGAKSALLNVNGGGVRSVALSGTGT